MKFEQANAVIQVLDEFPCLIIRKDDEPICVGERKLDLISSLLLAAENFSLEERLSIRSQLRWSVKPHGWTRNFGQPSKLQAQTILMLENARNSSDTPACVQSWATETIAELKGDLEDQQNDDDEFRR